MLRTEGSVTRPCSGTELLNASSDAVYLGEVDKSVLHKQFECKPDIANTPRLVLDVPF